MFFHFLPCLPSFFLLKLSQNPFVQNLVFSPEVKLRDNYITYLHNVFVQVLFTIWSHCWEILQTWMHFFAPVINSTCQEIRYLECCKFDYILNSNCDFYLKVLTIVTNIILRDFEDKLISWYVTTIPISSFFRQDGKTSVMTTLGHISLVSNMPCWHQH